MPRNPITGELNPKAKLGASQRGLGRKITENAIVNREDLVTNGALWGRATVHNGLPEYTVYSYREPIAHWSVAEGWRLTSVKFSNTTGRHQSMVRSALHGIPWTDHKARFGWTA
jgi:hypothetical protein